MYSSYKVESFKVVTKLTQTYYIFSLQSGDSQLQVSPSATGDLGSYLDSDLSLFEQPDELQILQADP